MYIINFVIDTNSDITHAVVYLILDTVSVDTQFQVDQNSYLQTNTSMDAYQNLINYGVFACAKILSKIIRNIKI